MMDAYHDVHRTLEYRTDASLIHDLPNGLFLCLLGLFVLTLDDEPPVEIVGAAAVVVGAKPKAWPVWDAVKVIVPLIAIVVVVANLLGLWATAGQLKARADRKAFADWSKARQEEDDRFEQETKEREKRFQELF